MHKIGAAISVLLNPNCSPHALIINISHHALFTLKTQVDRCVLKIHPNNELNNSKTENEVD